MVYSKQTLCNWQLVWTFPLKNRNSQHFHCCSLVLAYSFRSWLQSTCQCDQNIVVPAASIPKLRRPKVVFVNRINNCSGYVTKACHVASWQKRPLQNQNNKQAIANNLKGKSSCIHVLCNDILFCLRRDKQISLQSTLGLHSLFCQMHSEWKTSSKKTPKRRKQRKKPQKRTRMT